MIKVKHLSLYEGKLSLWLFAKSLLMILVIFYAGIGLSPDEAQYWTWSQALDWGYYSKPPGIAWQIGLGTQLFGQTEWGVRSLSVCLAILQAWMVYQLARQSGLKSKTAFWAGLCMAFCPLGILGSFFSITDVGFLFCWTTACLITVRGLEAPQGPSSLWIGCWILLGALFKWPIYSFWFFFLCCRYWYFSNQSKRQLLLGIVISLLGLLPSLWWSWSHDWATFRHVYATIQGGSVQRVGGNLGEFLGAQALLLSPILFILLCCAFKTWFEQRKSLSPSLFFCGFVTLICLGVGVVVSYFQKVQGNWIVFAYPTGFVLLAWYALEQFPRRLLWIKLGLGLSILLMVLVLVIPSFRLVAFKHQLGWPELKEALTQVGYQADTHFLVSDKYQTTSLLSFYNEGQKRAYFLNLHGVRKNQFSYWPSLQEEQQGKEGFFVWIESTSTLRHEGESKIAFYEQELPQYFEKVEFVEAIPLVYKGEQAAKVAFIFRCRECRERILPDSHLY